MKITNTEDHPMLVEYKACTFGSPHLVSLLVGAGNSIRIDGAINKGKIRIKYVAPPTDEEDDA